MEPEHDATQIQLNSAERNKIVSEIGERANFITEVTRRRNLVRAIAILGQRMSRPSVLMNSARVHLGVRRRIRTRCACDAHQPGAEPASGNSDNKWRRCARTIGLAPLLVAGLFRRRPSATPTRAHGARERSQGRPELICRQAAGGRRRASANLLIGREIVWAALTS